LNEIKTRRDVNRLLRSADFVNGVSQLGLLIALGVRFDAEFGDAPAAIVSGGTARERHDGCGRARICQKYTPVDLHRCPFSAPRSPPPSG
jgi:hypothetical protein